MERLEFYLNLRQGSLHEERKDLLTAIDRLIQEAQFFKGQVEAGHIYNPGLADRGRKVEDLAVSVQHLMGTVSMLESIRQDAE